MLTINNYFNICWFILFGWQLCLIWCFLGIIYYVTYFGIPFGAKCFKIGCFALWPFEKKIIYKIKNKTSCEYIFNIIWLIFGGLIASCFTAILSILPFISIIGMPFGVQLCQLSKAALMPLGSEIVGYGDLITPDRHHSLQDQNIPPSPQDKK